MANQREVKVVFNFLNKGGKEVAEQANQLEKLLQKIVDSNKKAATQQANDIAAINKQIDKEMKVELAKRLSYIDKETKAREAAVKKNAAINASIIAQIDKEMQKEYEIRVNAAKKINDQLTKDKIEAAKKEAKFISDIDKAMATAIKAAEKEKYKELNSMLKETSDTAKPVLTFWESLSVVMSGVNAALEIVGKAWDAFVVVMKAVYNAVSYVLGKLYDLASFLAGELYDATLKYAEVIGKVSTAAVILGTTNDEVMKFARNMAPMGKSISEVASGLEELGRAGFKATEAMKMYPIISAFATAQNVSLSEAATMTIGAMKAYNMTAKDTYWITNQLSNALNDSIINFEGLKVAFGYAGAEGAVYGQSLEQTLSMIGAYKDIGRMASQAGTAPRGVMSTMGGSVTGDKKKVLTELGLTPNDIVISVGRSVGEAFQILADKGMGVDQAKRYFGKLFAGPSFSIIQYMKSVKGKDGLNFIDQKAYDMLQRQNTALDMYVAKISNLKGYIDILKSQWEAFWTGIYEKSASPTITGIVLLLDLAALKINQYLGLVDSAGKASKDIKPMDIKTMEKGIIDSAKGVLDTLDNTFNAVKKGLAAAGAYIKDLFKSIFGEFDLGEWLKDELEKTNIMTTWVKDFIVVIMKIPFVFGSISQKVSKAFPEAIKATLSLVKDLLVNFVKTIVLTGDALITYLVKNPINYLRGLPSETVDMQKYDFSIDPKYYNKMKELWNERTMYDGLNESIDKGSQIMQTGIDKIFNFSTYDKAANAVKNGLGKVNTAITDGLVQAKVILKENEHTFSGFLERVVSPQRDRDKYNKDMAETLLWQNQGLPEYKKSTTGYNVDTTSKNYADINAMRAFGKANGPNDFMTDLVMQGSNPALDRQYGAVALQKYGNRFTQSERNQLRSGQMSLGDIAATTANVVGATSKDGKVTGGSLDVDRTMIKDIEKLGKARARLGKESKLMKQQFKEYMGGLVDSLSGKIATDLVNGTLKLKDIFKQFVKDMIAEAIKLFIIKQILGGLGGLFGGGSAVGGAGSVGKDFGGAEKMGSKFAFGSLMKGVIKAAGGSPSSGFGGGYQGSDSVHALLKPDEIVLNSSASQMFRNMALNGGSLGGGGTTVQLNVTTMDANSFKQNYNSMIRPLIQGDFKKNATFRRTAQESIEGKI
jgi:TP901 family phage tail tape measure protein